LWCPNRPALAVEALTQIARAAVRVVHFILRFSLTFSGSEREELRSRTARRLLIGTRGSPPLTRQWVHLRYGFVIPGNGL
jgi:hypothetical protein